jgi:hypothetical protein
MNHPSIRGIIVEIVITVSGCIGTAYFTRNIQSKKCMVCAYVGSFIFGSIMGNIIGKIHDRMYPNVPPVAPLVLPIDYGGGFNMILNDFDDYDAIHQWFILRELGINLTKTIG